MSQTEAAPVTRVLVVDDDPDINRLLGVRLSARGFKVRAAVDGEDALAKIGEETPDLIFLDVSMPGIGGLEVLDRVRADGLDLAVVMTTAFGSEKVAIEALRRGADDYLRKPFESGEFQAVLRRTVGRLELSRQNVALRTQVDEQRRQLEAELARAAQVQRDLLPRDLPSVPGIEIAARCIPARTIGGDFYDWQVVGDGVLSLTLGDVMGKGMPAALITATVRSALRAVASRAPVGAVEAARTALEDDLERASSYLTLFHACYDPSSSCLTFVDAGHGHVFVRRAGGGIAGLDPRGLPLGLSFGGGYEEGIVALAPGDALILYSDGLVEANPDALLDRQDVVAALDGAADAPAMLEHLVGLVGPTDALPDDLTVVVLRRLPT